MLPHEGNPKFDYIYGDSQYLSFRVPAFEDLKNLLNRVGPLVAPSANLQGLAPAISIDEAQAYFGDKVDFYLDSGKLDNLPSTVAILQGESFELVRAGGFDISKFDK